MKIVSLSILFLACACYREPEFEVESELERPEAVLAELVDIKEELKNIGQDRACTSDASCVALPADDHAGGTATAWLIFSTESPRYGEVESLLQRSSRLKRTHPETSFPHCDGQLEPALTCEAGTCQARELRTENAGLPGGIANHI